MRCYSTLTVKEKMVCGKSLYVTLVKDSQNGKIVKVLLTAGKSGQCHRALFEALQNVINVVLSNGGKTEEVVHALKGIRCESPKVGVATSCVDFVSRLLQEPDAILNTC